MSSRRPKDQNNESVSIRNASRKPYPVTKMERFNNLGEDVAIQRGKHAWSNVGDIKPSRLKQLRPRPTRLRQSEGQRQVANEVLVWVLGVTSGMANAPGPAGRLRRGRQGRQGAADNEGGTAQRGHGTTRRRPDGCTPWLVCLQSMRADHVAGDSAGNPFLRSDDVITIGL